MSIDVAVIGAGAAGLATAIFARQAAPSLRVVVFDGAKRPGAKILVSGGSRCNVTNVAVTERDYNGGRPAIVRQILRAFTADDTVDFFRGLGVPLHEEAHGKLFPDSNRSRDVLESLLRALEAAGGELRADHRVLAVTKVPGTTGGFELTTSQGVVESRQVVLATGGLSLPKTGSDGLGYELARRLGHTLVPTTPALVPLCLDAKDGGASHAGLSGVAQRVRLRVTSPGQRSVDIEGDMLWTHFGVSGPAALDASRHWLRHRLEGREAGLHVNLARTTFDMAEATWLSSAGTRPRQRVANALAAFVPASVADALAARAGLPPAQTVADLPRDARRRLIHALTDWPLPVVDSRGYNYAEVTAGGVDLREIDPATMASRRMSGLALVGEILDVDGRLGGFNFQWAWSTAFVAARGLAARAVG